MPRSFFVLTLLACGAVRGVAGQSPEQRAALDSLRAELGAASDSGALLRREAAGIARARVDRDNAALHLELGFIAYRLGEVTGDKRRFEDAASEFEWASELREDWPYPWYGLGLAELALGEHSLIGLENLRQAMGKDYLSKAARAFARAAAADPTFALAVVDLAETAMRQRIRAKVDVALEALRATAATPAAAVPAVQLARGRIELQQGEGDSALAAFQRYTALGGDSAIGLFEQARALYFLRRPAEGRGIYFAGARQVRSRDARAEYRADLSWIATPEELAEFDALPSDALSPWLERFWGRRDAADARRPGERLAEHQRRYFYAMRNFRLVSRHRAFDVTSRFRSTQQELDDRGVIYLRHGDPDRRATFAQPGLPGNESWQYVRGERDLIFHFVAHGLQDYRLVESLADVLGFEAALALQSGTTGSATLSALFESRAEMDPFYARRGRTSGAGDERRRGRVAIREGTTTDAYALRFASPLAPIVQTFVLGDSAAAAGRLLLVFAVPARTLVPEPLGRTVAYPITVRVSGVRDQVEPAPLVDTTRVFVADRPLSGDEHLSWFLEVPVAPGDYLLRVAMLQPGRDVGSVLPEDTLTVPPFGEPRFALSGLVAGRRASGLAWWDGADTVFLNPLRRYPAGSSIELYYHVQGLDRGARFHTRVEVRREGGRSPFGFLKGLFGGGSDAVAVDYDGVAQESFTRVFQRVPLGSLGEGRYRLTLTVSLPGSDARHARQAMLVVGPS